MYGTKAVASYWTLPWYRQSGKVTAFVVIGFVLFPPLLWLACVVCLTGGVYYDRLGKDGGLAKWSAGNKVAAVIVSSSKGRDRELAEQYRAGSDPARAVGAGATLTTRRSRATGPGATGTTDPDDARFRFNLRDDLTGWFVGEPNAGPWCGT